MQQQIGSASKVLVGRNTQIFFEQLLSLSNSKLVRPPQEEQKDAGSLTFETLVDNKLQIRLSDTQGNNYYLPQSSHL